MSRRNYRAPGHDCPGVRACQDHPKARVFLSVSCGLGCLGGDWFVIGPNSSIGTWAYRGEAFRQAHELARAAHLAAIENQAVTP